jgi:HEAT repeat protein
MEPTTDQRLEGAEAERLAALADLLGPEVNPGPRLPAVAACLDHPSEQVRLLAATVLGAAGAPAAEALARALDARQPVAVRIAAALGIARIGQKAAQAVVPLCRCLTVQEEDLRAVASIALAKIGASAVPSLRRMLQFSELPPVIAAVRSLAMIGPPASECLPEVEALGNRRSIPLSLACAVALAAVSGDPSRGIPLLERAASAPDPGLRRDAVEKIGELGPAGKKATTAVASCLSDQTPAVRAAAALALARIHCEPEESIRRLTPLLDDAEPAVRLNAIIAVASFGKEAQPAVARLQSRLQDPDAGVSAAAGAAIEAIQAK